MIIKIRSSVAFITCKYKVNFRDNTNTILRSKIVFLDFTLGIWSRESRVRVTFRRGAWFITKRQPDLRNSDYLRLVRFMYRLLSNPIRASVVVNVLWLVRNIFSKFALLKKLDKGIFTLHLFAFT